MGMIFNTDETLHLGREANVAFRRAVITAFRADSTNWSNTFGNLPRAGQHNPNGGTYDLVTNRLPVVGGTQIWIRPQSAATTQRWKNWLTLFDSQTNHRSSVANEIVATTVGKAIAGVIQNTSLHGVEFFIVPDTGGSISANYIDFTDGSGDLTRAITIYTNTHDLLLESLSVHHRQRRE
jgi:hypothetical protein